MLKCSFAKCQREATHRLYDNLYYCDGHGFPYTDRAVTLLLPQYHPTLKILGVSRRSDHSNWGLPGGKVEPSDLNDLDAITREVYEECGIEISNLLPIFTYLVPGKIITTYTALSFRGVPHTMPNEGKCKWINPNLTLKGSFSIYNSKLFKYIGWSI